MIRQRNTESQTSPIADAMPSFSLSDSSPVVGESIGTEMTPNIFTPNELLMIQWQAEANVTKYLAQKAQGEIEAWYVENAWKNGHRDGLD